MGQTEDTVASDWEPEADTQLVDVGGGGAPAAFGNRDFTARYVPGDLLGIGGMGEVRAWSDLASGREVAMKTIRRDRREDIAVQRFVREARVQAQLEHPSIVPVYDLGADDDGALYFTMKQVRGLSLARVLAARATAPDGDTTWSLRKLLGVIARVAMTLEYAHRRGVVNRDLKPSNIMLGAFDEVYVLDWGLATLHDPSQPPLSKSDLLGGMPIPAGSGLLRPLLDSSEQPQTAAGQLIGTPAYVAPEQVHSPERVDGRADVYALGVVLFELLTGQRLHTGETLADVLISTLQTDGAHPAARAPGRNIPPELDELVARCTRIDPAERPWARGIARAIEAYLDGDRDLERRRSQAAATTERAAATYEASRADGADSVALRARALQELGRALTLDPEHVPARRALVRVLTEPSPVVPLAAELELNARRVQAIQVSARSASLGLLSYWLFVPIGIWAGIRHPWMAVVMGVSLALVTGLTFFYSRRPPAELRPPLPHLIASTVAMFTGVWLFGPLLLLPLMAMVNGVGYIVTFSRWSAVFVIQAIAIVVVPIALQLVGVMPPSYVIEDGTLRILPQLLDFPPHATWTLLIAIHAVVIAAALVYVARLRRAYDDTQRELQVQAWYLAQLVPSTTSPAARPR